MKRRLQQTVLAGFEVPAGDDVEIPLNHLCITGQTQNSGKTTTLEALVKRSGLKAIAFRTKRGEQAFGGAREIDPYFSDAGDWQFVSSILEASRREKLKFERSWIIKASRGARTLAEVHRNVQRELKTARGISEGVYTVLDAYLDVVVPQIAGLTLASTVDLAPGLNVMDLTAHTIEMQALVMRSVLEWVHEREEGVVTIIPEAWEFIPQNRGSPVKLSIERLIRKGAGLGNYVWLDSQDLGGIHKDIVRSCPVMLFGVQREANEIKRNLANIPADMRKPPAAEIARLGIGEFYVCHGKQTVKTYIWPAWMTEANARAIAHGQLSIDEVATRAWTKFANTPRSSEEKESRGRSSPAAPQPYLPNEDDEMSKEDVQAIRSDIGTLTKSIGDLVNTMKRPAAAASSPAAAAASNGQVDQEQLYNYVRDRLQEEAPRLLSVAAAVPELRVTEELKTIEASTSGKGALLGRLAILIADGFFDTPQSDQAIRDELKRYGLVAQKSFANVTYSGNKNDLVKWGFLFVEDGNYQANPRMKKHIKRV